jgi:hypothetical protein
VKLSLHPALVIQPMAQSLSPSDKTALAYAYKSLSAIAMLFSMSLASCTFA